MAARPLWLPSWSARSAAEIWEVRELAAALGRAAAGAGTLDSDPRVGFGDGVRMATAWALGDRVPAPTRGGSVVGPAAGPEEVRYERDLTLARLVCAPERFRPYAEGIVAGCEWLIGERESIAYPGGTVA